MRSHRGSWLGPCLLAAAFVSMPAACTVGRAQPGFGPDPFWPYNNQYTPYTEPIGPADPVAGGRASALPRDGIRGANQFQEYLDNLQGGSPGRNFSDRAGIGMPYYRSSVNPLYDPKGTRQYTPNRMSAESFERAQQRVADRYFAYYSTRNPARAPSCGRSTARRDATRTESRRAGDPRRLAAPERPRCSSRPPARSTTRVRPGRVRASWTGPRRGATASDRLPRCRGSDRGVLPARGPTRRPPARSSTVRERWIAAPACVRA